MLKAGNYLCKVTAPSNGWFGEAGESNTPFIRIPLIVIEDGDCEGEQVTFQGWLTDKSLDRTVKNLAEVFGWDGDLEALAKLLNTGPFVGKECRIVMENETYNGKTYCRLKWLNSAGSGGVTMSPEKALEIARRLQVRAKAAVAESADAPKDSPRESRRQARASAPSPDPDLDLAADDVPF